MNKDVILKEFLELKKDGGINEKFSSFEELVNVLSQMFEEEYESSSDAQEAYNCLNDNLEGLLGKHCAVYKLGTEEWSIDCDSKATKESIKNVITKWNDYYGSKNTTIEGVCDAITHKVMKTTSNYGCDAHNALFEICLDVFEDGHPFFVNIGDENPRIEFLE